MSRTVRNFVAAYAAFVALPLAGLLGVIRHGRDLKAPVSVEGVWKLQTDRDKLGGLSCGQGFAAEEDATLTIAQSGKYLLLSFNDRASTRAQGTLDGTNIRATLGFPAMHEQESTCNGKLGARLTATLSPPKDPTLLVGVLSARDCPACPPMEIRAWRANSGSRGAR